MPVVDSIDRYFELGAFHLSGDEMKKAKENDEMSKEYKKEDLGKGVRGKYYESYMEGHNLVLLKPEVVKAFPSEEAVNEALLSLIKIAQATAGRPGL